MAGKIKGIEIEIGGNTAGINKALGEMNKNVRTTQKELNEVEKLLKLDPTNTELLAQKQKLLAQEVDTTTQNLNALKIAKDKAEHAGDMEKYPEQYRKLQRAIIQAEQDLKSFTSQMDSAGDEAQDTGKALDNMGDSAQGAGDGFTVGKGIISDFVSNGLQSLISGAKEAAAETLAYREDMAKLNTAFETAGFSADTAKQAYSDFYSILGESDRSVEAANHVAQLATSEEDVATWGNIAAGVTATFGDSLPIEGLTEAANETAKVGTVTGTLADALNWVGISEDEFNQKLSECTSEQERSKLITETLNTAYQDASAKYKEMNADVLAGRDATREYEAAMAELGGIVQPIITALTSAVASLIQWIVANKESVIAAIVSIGAAFLALKAKDIIDGIKNSFTALNAVMSASPILLVVSLIGILVTAFITLWNNCEGFRNFFIGMWQGIQTAFQAFLDWISPAVEVVKTAFSGLWTKMQEIFTTIVNALIPVKDALVTTFQGAWTAISAVWDTVLGYFQGIWSGIQAVFSVVASVLGSFFSAAWTAITVVWDVVTGYFQGVWDTIRITFSVVAETLSGFFSTAWEWIKVVWDTVTGYFQTIWDTIKGIFSVVKDVLSGNWSDAWEGIKGIVDTWAGYFGERWTDIKNAFSETVSWFSTLFTDAWTAIKNVFSNWGTFFSGLWGTIKDTFSTLGTSIANAIGGAVKSGINGVISLIQNTINSAINLINGAIGLINKIPGVSIGTIGHVSLPMLAKGGVLSSGSAIVGEAGPELLTVRNGRAVVQPLTNGGGFSKNTAPTINNYNYGVTPETAFTVSEQTRRIMNQLALQGAL